MEALTDIKISQELSQELRLCKVGSQFGYFHCWEQYAKPIAPGVMIGSHPGGQYSEVFGIVELPDGVKRVGVHKIKFCDEDHQFLCDLNECEEERGEKEK